MGFLVPPHIMVNKMTCPNKYQKSSLNVYNTSEQSFKTTPGNIVFSNIGYQSGVSIKAKENSDTIYLKSNGLYYITADILMSNETGASDTIVQMYADGALVPGAMTMATLTLTTDIDTGTISALIPVNKCGCPCMCGKTITFQASGTTPVIQGINVNVIKIA